MEERITKEEMEKTHPYIPEAYEQLKQGRVSRREFMRLATLLGMSAGVATMAAACGTPEEEPEPEPEAEPTAEEETAEETVEETAEDAHRRHQARRRYSRCHPSPGC